MKLRELTGAISSEEVNRQAFRYEPHNWQSYPEVPRLLKEAGYTAEEIKAGFAISRQDIRKMFEKGNALSGIMLALIWGYPKGVVGPGNRKPLHSAVTHVNQIAAHLETFKENLSPATAVLTAMSFAHIGLSTLSKILYFAGLEVEEGKLLIYDQMVMRALHRHQFEEYGSWPKYGNNAQINSYPAFIKKTNAVAQVLGYGPDNIEYALFREGQRLPGQHQHHPDAASEIPQMQAVHVNEQEWAQAKTWGGRSSFLYQITIHDDVILRFGKEHRTTVLNDDVSKLCSHFKVTGKLVPSTSNSEESLDAWLKKHVTSVRISSYLAPVLVLEGLAVREQNKLRFI